MKDDVPPIKMGFKVRRKKFFWVCCPFFPLIALPILFCPPFSARGGEMGAAAAAAAATSPSSQREKKTFNNHFPSSLQDSVRHLLSNYLCRFSSIAGPAITCGPVLNW